MAEYRLSRRAEGDVLAIYDFTERTFGQYQADAYHAGLERIFGLLADFPRMGPSADELKPGFRRFRFQSHLVFYTEELAHVFIRALIHVRMNLRPDSLRLASRYSPFDLSTPHALTPTFPARITRAPCSTRPTSIPSSTSSNRR